jgi:hypothetical protein
MQPQERGLTLVTIWTGVCSCRSNECEVGVKTLTARNETSLRLYTPWVFAFTKYPQQVASEVQKYESNWIAHVGIPRTVQGNRISLTMLIRASFKQAESSLGAHRPQNQVNAAKKVTRIHFSACPPQFA